ncbi:MAG TPA: permease-like cell division protein FtsX [Candidatus Desulfaltia sp.]|nr:permease-like cell division protein FtsX [Candidatus Desulfaltia sp.]
MNNLWQYRTRNLLSITIICLSFLILGVFFSLSNNLQYIADQTSENMMVVFFLSPDATAAELSHIEQRIRSSPYVVRMNRVSSQQAWERFQKNFPELREILKNLGTNPFPPSFEATLQKKAFMSNEILGFIEDIKNTKGVEDVQFNRDWVQKMQSLSRLARAIGFFLGGILILASFFIISNVIRLNVFARQGEIEILRFVGASNTFIRLPFLLEGVTLGILGSTLSLGLLFLLVRLFPLYLGHSLGALQEIINFRYLSLSQALGMVVGGVLMGGLGSLSSLSRFLKI